MSIDKQALRDSAESILCVLENIAGFEPSDIDGDTLELRFETEDGFDTGCDVSIVDQCQRAVEVVRALLNELEAAEKRIASLNEQLVDCRGIVSVQATGRRELRQRIAELEENHDKLREGMAAIYNAICAGNASTSLSAIRTFVKRSFEESGAGLQLKVEK